MRTMTVEELQAKLKNISKDMLPAIKKAMIDAAQNIEGKAKENCPVITGTLRRSVSSKVEQEGKAIKGIVGAGTEYAAAVHEGTSKQSSNPFILNAIREKKNETTGILTDAIEEALRKHTI